MVTKAQLEGTGVSKRGVLMVGLRLAQATRDNHGRAGELAKDYIHALGILRPDLIEAARKQDEKAVLSK